MLILGRKEGASVVLTDSDGRLMTVTVTGLVRETGYMHLHVTTQTNYFAATLAPSCELKVGSSREFDSAIGVTNGNTGRLRPSLDGRLIFDVPKDVQVYRSEILAAVAQGVSP